jgi:hypothetical protein
MFDEYLSCDSTNSDQPNVWKSSVETVNIKFHCPEANVVDALVNA